jgi:hypothetical protein
MQFVADYHMFSMEQQIAGSSGTFVEESWDPLALVAHLPLDFSGGNKYTSVATLLNTLLNNTHGET